MEPVTSSLPPFHLIRHVGQDSRAAARLAAEALNGWAIQAVAQRGRFLVSLAGGSTPQSAYHLWRELPGLDWSRVELLQGDERCVAPDHPASNAGMVRGCLLDGFSPQPLFHRIHGEEEPQQAAQSYDRLLRQLLKYGQKLDVALLGIGEDGHTASLFPGQPALEERIQWAATALAPVEPKARVTVTLPLLWQTRRVAFLATGPAKRNILSRLLEGPYQPHLLPAQFLLRKEGQLEWLLAQPEETTPALLPWPEEIHLFVDAAADTTA